MRKTAGIALLSVLTVFPALAAGPSDHETASQVPELTAFHEVIYPLWHEAWPKKDLAALSALLPQIETGAAKIEKAELPGILREKKQVWTAGVEKLHEIVSQYRDAVEKKELQPLLDAAERLHAQYETLVRTIRPALPEMDAFHQVLYRLYHYEMHAFSLPTIQGTVRELKDKMNALDRAVLPKRLEPKQAAFDGRRGELSRSVADLVAVAEAGKDEAAVKAAIESMHGRYEALAGLF